MADIELGVGGEDKKRKRSGGFSDKLESLHRKNNDKINELMQKQHAQANGLEDMYHMVSSYRDLANIMKLKFENLNLAKDKEQYENADNTEKGAKIRENIELKYSENIGSRITRIGGGVISSIAGKVSENWNEGGVTGVAYALGWGLATLVATPIIAAATATTATVGAVISLNSSAYKYVNSKFDELEGRKKAQKEEEQDEHAENPPRNAYS